MKSQPPSDQSKIAGFAMRCESLGEWYFDTDINEVFACRCMKKGCRCMHCLCECTPRSASLAFDEEEARR